MHRKANSTATELGEKKNIALTGTLGHKFIKALRRTDALDII